jgi:hypothetical protein
MKANKTTRVEAVSNPRRRKDKESESNIESAAHNQNLKQQKQPNDTYLHCLANWIKKEDPTISSLQGTHLIDRKNTALG